MHCSIGSSSVGRSGLLALSELLILRMVVNVVIRLALTGETIYEHTFPAVEELRVWELRQHFCLVIGSDAYFAWQLVDAHRLLKDHYYVANAAKSMDTEISLIAIKRRLRPPTLDERADILYYVSIGHRRKLWKLVSKGIQLQSTTGKIRYALLSERLRLIPWRCRRIIAFLTQCKHCYGPNVIPTTVEQTNAFLSAKRYGPVMTVPWTNC